MSPAQLEIQLVAVVVAAACAVPGVFLVLRRMAMMSDAISHAILPGIVLAFFVTGNLNSPLLLLAAAATGVLTVVLVELIESTRLVREDAAIGIVFPVLFSAGVVLIARYAGDVHLDTDAVLLGELAFAPFDRFVLGGVDLGPQALWSMGAVLVLNVLFVGLFYKELKLSTFDAGLAAALGFLPGLLHYALMALVSLTAVAAFDAVGAVLVVAFIAGPPVTAYLLTDRLPRLLGLSAGIGVVCAVAGFWAAMVFDVSIAGAMATAVGLVLALVFVTAPDRGLWATWRRRRRQRTVFFEKMLVIHLLQHEGTPEEARENRPAHLEEHFGWDPATADEVVRRARRRGTVTTPDGRLVLTDAGRVLARQALEET